MRILNLRQQTPEWLAWRRAGIGASDSTVIMGEVIDPERPVTTEDLLAEKLSLGQREQTFAMRRGIWMESPALTLLQEREGVLLRPACVECDDAPWLRASLDGLTFLRDLCAEVKSPKVLDHECALSGIVPHHYRPQVQHQLIVTDLPCCWYVSYSVAKRFGGKEKPSLAVVEVEADAEYQARLLGAVTAFWSRLQRCRQAGNKLVA